MHRVLSASLFFASISVAADTAKLDAWRDDLAQRKTVALYVMQKGKVVYEWYAPGHSADRRQGTASLAKALVGGMTLMTAMKDGKIGPDDLASKYIPAWRTDPRKNRITIRHLATHSSGIQDANIDGVPHEKLPGWMGAFWRRHPDPFSISLRDSPVIIEPGSDYHYSNPGMAALAYAVTAATGQDLQTILKDRVLGPLGVPDSEWSIGYNRAYEVDGLKLFANWGGGAFTPRSAARIGQYMMREGLHMTKYAGTPLPDRVKAPMSPGSGLCWWTNFDGVWPNLPRDAFAGAGAGQEVMLVVPSLDLIVVRNGNYMTPAGSKEFWTAIVEHLFNPAIKFFGAPYPQSTVIRGVRFASPETIRRHAIDSDNWPMTWGADDRIYTSYGDGRGFDPKTDRKLSLGYAALDGGPSNYKAVNIRSASGERTGEGKAGLKSSGMLMVKGVLYMWVRNASNAQLAWSNDLGKTWQWGFKFDTSMGTPSFLNFGKNYASARDKFVYTYSQDGPSAYQPSDAIILARAPAAKMKDRAAWEFYTGLDSSGQPKWSHDINARRPVFEFTGKCERTDAVYVPALKRYLLAVSYNHEGGWGIYDAPEPWGPWTTAFHTENWGLGPTHGYRLPAKWISPDGRTLNLVFSGKSGKGMHYDAFSVRQMEFDLATPVSAR